MFSAFPVRVVQLVDGTDDQFALVDVETVVRQINFGMLDSTPARGGGCWPTWASRWKSSTRRRHGRPWKDSS